MARCGAQLGLLGALLVPLRSRWRWSARSRRCRSPPICACGGARRSSRAGCLGIAGALFQSLTRNLLASPDLLGVMGGGQRGLLAVMLVPALALALALAGVASVPLLFACGLLAVACAIAAAGGWRATSLRLVLAGSVCMLLFAALWANGSLYQPRASGLATDSAVLSAGLDATLSTGVAIALVGTPMMLARIRRDAA